MKVIVGVSWALHQPRCACQMNALPLSPRLNAGAGSKLVRSSSTATRPMALPPLPTRITRRKRLCASITFGLCIRSDYRSRCTGYPWAIPDGEARPDSAALRCPEARTACPACGATLAGAGVFLLRMQGQQWCAIDGATLIAPKPSMTVVPSVISCSAVLGFASRRRRLRRRLRLQLADAVSGKGSGVF